MAQNEMMARHCPPFWVRLSDVLEFNLGRYLYRGVVSERDILRCKDGLLTYRWRDAESGQPAARTLPGADFLWLLLLQVLPKGKQRATNFDLLHHNSRRTLRLLQLLNLLSGPPAAQVSAQAPSQCPICSYACGGAMVILRRRMRPDAVSACAAPPTEQPDEASPVEVVKH